MKRALLVLLATLALAACEREKREARADPIATETDEKIALVRLSPGDAGPTETRTGKGKDYENNAYHMSEGKRLYSWFNCVGCHANGGGGMGPPLMDDEWIYGSDPENIFATIVEGRPNGMPSFRGRIPDYQVWQLAAYVRSMSGQAPMDAAPARSDHMNVKKPESQTKKETPQNVSVPQPATKSE